MYSYSNTYDSPSMRRSTLSSARTPRTPSSTPTLDQARLERAARSGTIATTPTRRANIAYGASSPAASGIGEGVPPGAGSPVSRTAQLNLSMLESKVTKLEHEQGTMSAQIRSELEGLFHDRIRALETTVTGAVQKHQQELERQQSHFGTLCGRLERCVPPRPARTPCRQRATAPLTKALVLSAVWRTCKRR